MLYIDFETYSDINIKEYGITKSLESENADIIVMGYCDSNGNLNYTTNKDEMISILNAHKNDYIGAFNARFEYLVIKNILKLKIPYSKFKCLMEKSNINGYFGNLSQIVSVVTHCKINKKIDIKQKVSKYWKPNKHGERLEIPESDMNLMADYCMHDAYCTYVLDKMLNLELSDFEKSISIINNYINDCGLPMDRELLNIINDSYTEFKNKECDISHLNLTIKGATKDIPIVSTTQGESIKKYFTSIGEVITGFGKNDIEKIKTNNEDLKYIIEIKKLTSATSIAKTKTMINYLKSNDRICDWSKYHATFTGRFASYGVQMLNLPRITSPDAHKDVKFKLKQFLDTNTLESKNNYVEAIKSCIRPCIKAPKGKMFISFDYSNIEPRILSLISGDFKVINAVKNKKDIYKDAYSKIFNVPEDEVTKSQRQLAKILELSCCYGATSHTIKRSLIQNGIECDDVKARILLANWKIANVRLTNYWKTCDDLYRKSINKRLNEKRDVSYLKLPSGRSICYLLSGEDEKGLHYSEIVTPAKDSDYILSSYLRTTYLQEGKITNHIVQSIARDVLCNCINNLVKNRYKVIFHFHDEVMIEINDTDDVLDHIVRIKEIAETPPEWLKELPLDIEYDYTENYTK